MIWQVAQIVIGIALGLALLAVALFIIGAILESLRRNRKAVFFGFAVVVLAFFFAFCITRIFFPN